MKFIKWVKESFLLARQDTVQFARGVIPEYNKDLAAYRARVSNALVDLGWLPPGWVRERALIECVTTEEFGLGYKE